MAGISRVGPYRVESELARGNTADLFVAVREGPEGFEQRVCLKCLLPEITDDPKLRELAIAEIQTAATIRHRGIVPVLDFGESNGTYFVATELIEGLSLERFLEANADDALPAGVVALIALDVAEALDHAHTHEVDGHIVPFFHRDICPGNILLSRAGGVLLTDFGLPELGAGQEKLGSQGVFTVYSAPEQQRREAVDARTDLYSLGVVMYHLLAGEPPFLGRESNPTNALGRVAPSLIEKRPELPEGLAKIVMALVAPDPVSRPESAAELINLLSEFAPPITVRRRLARLVKMAEKAAPKKKPRPVMPKTAATSGPTFPAGGPTFSDDSTTIPEETDDPTGEADFLEMPTVATGMERPSQEIIDAYEERISDPDFGDPTIPLAQSKFAGDAPDDLDEKPTELREWGGPSQEAIEAFEAEGAAPLLLTSAKASPPSAEVDLDKATEVLELNDAQADQLAQAAAQSAVSRPSAPAVGAPPGVIGRPRPPSIEGASVPPPPPPAQPRWMMGVLVGSFVLMLAVIITVISINASGPDEPPPPAESGAQP